MKLRPAKPNAEPGRVVLYARYSDSKQDPSSIEAQFAIGRDFAAHMGWTVVGEYSDAMITDATKSRPGYQEMLAFARGGGADIVLAEALDRITRDPEEAHGVFKRLKHDGIKLVTLAEGEVSSLHVAVSGIANALYLEAVSFKTRRSLREKILRGEIIPGLAYGFTVRKTYSPEGQLLSSRYEIDPEQAKVVIEIFERYKRGHSPNQIAKDLNARGIPGPRGGIWHGTTIRGHAERASGILRNELYIGVVVWNRQTFVRNPDDDAKRVSRINEKEEWVRVDVPELAFIPRDLWDRVQARLAAIGSSETAEKIRASEPWKHRRQHLLTGRAVCACCGNELSNSGKDYLACNTARLSPTCTNSGSVRREVLEEQVLAGLRECLMQDDMVAGFSAAFEAALKTEDRDRAGENRAVEAQLKQVRRDLEGFEATARQGRLTDRLHTKMVELEQQEHALMAKLTAPAAPPITLPPGLAEMYRTRIADLAATIAEAGLRTEARDVLQRLVTRIAVTFGPDARTCEIDLEGDIVALLTFSLGADSKTAACSAAGLEARACSVKVVAGAGFEPTTFRL